MEHSTIEHVCETTQIKLPIIETKTNENPKKITKNDVYTELNKANINGWFSLPIAQIYPGLFLGNIFHAQDIHFRIDNNIKTIINCATYEAQPLLLNVFTYVCLNASDSPSYRIIDTHFSYVCEIIDMSLEKGWNVLLHCQCGINRSATLAIAYYCMKYQCSIEKAILDVFSVRPCILTNNGFREQLFEWYENQFWSETYIPQSISLIELNSDNESDKNVKKMEIIYNKDL